MLRLFQIGRGKAEKASIRFHKWIECWIGTSFDGNRISWISYHYKNTSLLEFVFEWIRGIAPARAALRGAMEGEDIGV
jgi:hypothetical protein